MSVLAKYSLSADSQMVQDLHGKVDAEVLREIQKADRSYVARLATEMVNLAEQKRARIETHRNTSTRKKFSAKVLKLASRIDDFLHVFSGIVEVVKGVDQQAGPIAYGSLALLLTVAKNKQLHDEVIADTLDVFHRWLSRLRAIRIAEEKDEKVQADVMRIYEKVIDCSQSSIRYYNQSSMRRFTQAVTKPPQLYREKHAEGIKESIADLMQELAVIQHVRIKQISDDTAVNNRRQSLEEILGHDERVKKVERLLGVPPDLTAESMLRDDKRKFTGMFSKGTPKVGVGRKAPCLNEISLEVLSQRPHYRAWVARESSCLLLLDGENYDGYDPSRRPCWLSPVAGEFFEHVQGSSGCRAAFHSLSGGRTPEALTLLMLKSMTIQLLKQDRTLCREKSSEICDLYNESRQLDSGLYALDQTEKLIGVMFQILDIIFRSIARGLTVYLILNGIEYLHTQMPKVFFRQLLDLIDDPDLKVVIKAFAICRSGYWPDVDLQDRSGLQSALGIGGHHARMKRVFYDSKWKQEALGTFT